MISKRRQAAKKWRRWHLYCHLIPQPLHVDRETYEWLREMDESDGD